MAEPVRITEVRIHRLEGNISRRFGWSLGWTKKRTAALVEVRTDAGITGWGDGFWGGDILRRDPEIVIGRSPFEAEGIYEAMRPAPEMQRRMGAPVCGGLDTALWDLMGQISGQPVWRLMGRQYRTHAEPYCTALYRQEWPDLAQGLAEEALEWKRQGFRTIKMKIGFGLETDVRIVSAVREAIGGCMGLAVDSNCAYDPGTAVSLGRQLEPFNLSWWEEPLPADDFEGYARVRQNVRIPISGGETFDADRLAADYVSKRLVDILQPEVEIIGLTGARRLTTLCWLNHMRIIPHNWGTAVRTAAILHWMMTVPPVNESLQARNAMFEFDQTEHPFRDAVIREQLRPDSDGLMKPPDGPGLGVTVAPEALEEFRTELIEIR